MQKKGQANVIDFFKVLVVGGILAIIGVLIFSQVDSSADNIFDRDSIHATNESITIQMNDGSPNSTLLTFDDIQAGSEIVANASDSSKTLVDGTEYTLVDSTGNFTLLNESLNNSALFISYNHLEDSAAMTTSDTIGSTVLDSFELGVIAFIVMAAVVILSALFLLSK